MVTNGSVLGLGPIYKSDLWIYFRDAGVPSAVFISGDPFISGFPGLVQRVLWSSVQRMSGDDGDVSFSSVYFGTLSGICGYIFLQMVVISSEIKALVQ